jgi:LPS O-antigen subunit length determinant protein (WzzB/FepE family)
MKETFRRWLCSTFALVPLSVFFETRDRAEACNRIDQVKLANRKAENETLKSALQALDAELRNEQAAARALKGALLERDRQLAAALNPSIEQALDAAIAAATRRAKEACSP